MRIQDILEALEQGSKKILIPPESAVKYTPEILEKYTKIATQGPLKYHVQTAQLMMKKPNESQEEWGRDIIAMGMATRLWQLIERQCSDVVGAMKSTGRLLYRGATYYGPAYLAAPWAARKPKDTSRDIQTTVDDFLQAAGFQALRGNSIYATSNRMDANSYVHGGGAKQPGKLHAIFPLNGSHITWNSKIDDFYSTIVDSPSNYFDPEEWLNSPPEEVIDAARLYNKMHDLVYDAYQVASELNNPTLKSFFTILLAEFPHIPKDFGQDVHLTQNFFKQYGEEFAKNKLNQLANYFPPNKQPPTPLKIFNKVTYLTSFLKEVPQIQKALMVAMTKSKPNEREQAERLGFRMGDWPAALESGNEIYINGQYVAVALSTFDQPSRYFEDILKTYLNIDI